MRKIRVLVVDDSTVVRRMVSDALAGDPAIEVVGTASNGKIGLTKIPLLNPDIVTLDMEMPEMDGLQTLPVLRQRHPRLPVIMFSTLTQKGAVSTLDALSLGATDYVAKPSNIGMVTAGIQSVKGELIPKIKAICGELLREDGPVAAKQPLKPVLPRAAAALSRPKINQRIDLLAIGVSTGGPNALTEVFRRLPANFPVPIVIVQHMPPLFTRCLADRLNNVSPLEVREAQGGEILEPGIAWMAPGDFHLTLTPSVFGLKTSLAQGPAENSCRPAVDVLFRSVARHVGTHALGLILTGMGQDGLIGSELIRQVGGTILAQDEASSVVWGMPGAVARAGFADEILSLHQIPQALVNRCSVSRVSSPATSYAKS